VFSGSRANLQRRVGYEGLRYVCQIVNFNSKHIIIELKVVVAVGGGVIESREVEIECSEVSLQ
jgi:hypothetical protein